MRVNQLPERWLHDPLYRALEAGNLRAARAMLDKRDSLSWHETAVYAPLALRRPLWLLRRILDLGPAEQVCCAGEFVRPGGGWVIRMSVTLLTAAAALDDLPAVKELVSRGYCLDLPSIRKMFYLDVVDKWTGEQRDWYQENHTWFSDLDRVLLLPIGGFPEFMMCRFAEYRQFNTPLSTAIWCGAVDCVEYLLPDRAEDLNLSERNALSWGPLPGDEARRQAVEEAVRRRYGLALEELLDPGEFQNRDSPLFLPCLERHPEWFHLSLVRRLVADGWQDDRRWERKNWVWNMLPLIPPHLLSAVVIEQLEIGAVKDLMNGVFAHPLVHLEVDRCAVPPETRPEPLIEILERMTITGKAPADGLSGLAAALLSAMSGCLHRQGNLEGRFRGLLARSKVRLILEEEPPEMIRAYLDQEAEEKRISCQDVYLMMNLLNWKEECDYDL